MKQEDIQSVGVGEMFRSEGLSAPYLPEDLEGFLVKQGDGLIYSTRQLPADIYDVDFYINEAITQKVGNYLIVGFSGHGTASWNVHYYLKYNNLLIFLQLKWGGFVNNPDYQKTKINGCFSGIPIMMTI